MSNIGKNITALRIGKGWSQEELAKHSGVSQGTIGHLESGRNKSSTLLPKIAAALDSTVEELMGLKPPKIYTTNFDGTIERVERFQDIQATRRYVVSRLGDPSVDGEHAYEIDPANGNEFLFPVPDDRMAPRFMRGDFAIVEPSVDPDIEDDVLVKRTTGELGLYRLLSRRNGVRLGAWNEQLIVTLAESELESMYYVSGFVPRRKIRISEFVKVHGRLPRSSDEP
jgi:transcriptional regulator with XRE-family HTH domain